MPAMEREPLDLRLAPSAIACWGAAALGLGWSPQRAFLAAALLWVVGGLLLGSPTRLAGGWRLAAVAILLVAGTAMAAAGLRVDAVRAGPLRSLASAGALVHIRGKVASDPVLERGQFTPYVLVSLTAQSVTSRGSTTTVRSPVLVIGEASWLRGGSTEWRSRRSDTSSSLMVPIWQPC